MKYDPVASYETIISQHCLQEKKAISFEKVKVSHEWLSGTMAQVNRSVVFEFPSRVSKNGDPLAFFSYLVSCISLISASCLTRNYIMFSWKVSDKYPKIVSSSYLTFENLPMPSTVPGTKQLFI